MLIILTTSFGAFDGNGRYSPYELACPRGQVAGGVFMYPDSSYQINGIQVLCRTLELSEVQGTNPLVYDVTLQQGGTSAITGGSRGFDPPATLNCPAGPVVTGFDGKFRPESDGVYRFRLHCSSISDLAAPNNYLPQTTLEGTTEYAGRDRGEVFTYDCPANTVVVSMYGDADNTRGFPQWIGLGCAALAAIPR